MGYAGSILYRLTWKERVTPLGRPICALRARAWTMPTAKKARQPSNGYEGPWNLVQIPSSQPGFVILPHSLAERLAMALRISANGCIGWPTPTLHDAERGGQAKRAQGETRHGSNLQDFAMLAGWPTPCVTEPDTHPEKVWERKQRLTAKTGIYRGNDCGLGSKVQLAGWPTPMAGSPGTETYNEAGNNDSSRKTVALAGWPTPTTRDHKDGASEGAVPENGLLGRTVWLARTGSSASTEKPGQLNPEFSLSLMVGPWSTEWARCAARVTRSTSKRRSRS